MPRATYDRCMIVLSHFDCFMHGRMCVLEMHGACNSKQYNVNDLLLSPLVIEYNHKSTYC